MLKKLKRSLEIENLLKGKIINFEGLDMYVVGNGTTAIIWNYDVFGFDAGRTREYWLVP